MNYKKYQHIEKLGCSEVDGILNGTVELFYKIDGTNAVVFLNENKELGFGSRTRELTLDNDNGKFMASVTLDLGLYEALLGYLNKYPSRIIYGEWLIPHTLRTYKQDSWKKFYVFDVYETEGNYYIPYEEYDKELSSLGINVIPRIAKLENPSLEELEAYLDKTGNFLVTEGLGEGIVIKNYKFVNRFGRITWAKMLTEDFKKNKQHIRTGNKEDAEKNPIEHQIITKFMTPEFVQKEYHKLIELRGEWSSKLIFELLNRVFTEFWSDNWEMILKRFKMPTINFKALKTLCDKFTKETLKI